MSGISLPSSALIRVAVILAAAMLCALQATSSELPPDKSRPCFPGAGYRKAVSSVDTWNGIDAVVTLPVPEYDPKRMRSDGKRFLDNASIYLGGHAEAQEADCGLSWEVIREPDGSVSPTAKAFRPFWRVTSWNSGPTDPEYYYYPGDTVKISCRTTSEPDQLRMDVLLLKRAAEPTTAAVAGSSGRPDRVVWQPFNADAATTAQQERWSSVDIATACADPVSSFSVTFDAPGFGPGRVQEFKRVNGLDQVGNEGRDVQPTETRIVGAVWREVNLFRGGRGDLRVPMTPRRFTDMRCPDPKQIRVEPLGISGERVDLLGVGSGR